MKIAVTSDLHGNLPEIEECDLLLICGDIIPLHYQSKMIPSENWILSKFIPWCRDCKAKKVVFIAGNHDYLFERCMARMLELASTWEKLGIYYLHNTGIELDGLKIFGTPYCKTFGSWAFMRAPERLKQHYSEIPNNLDILISHDAPKINTFGVILYGPFVTDPPTDAGNPWLAEAILDKKPKYAFCGHIHSGDHNLQPINEFTTMANVSLVNESYEVANPILYFNYESK